MRLAVTGASGFVGGRVARALSAEGHDVRAFGRRATTLPAYATWDLDAGPIDLHDIDALVHCAAAVGQWGGLARFHRTNVIGTRHALASLHQRARVIYVSSASVYRTGSREPLSERAPTDGGSAAYVATKLEAERLVLGDEREGVVLRPHVIHGPGDTTLWPRVLAARRGGRLLVPGTGRLAISTTHVDNLVEAIRRCLAPGAPTGVFNIADAHAPTVDALLRTAFARRQEPVRLHYLPRAIAWPAAALVEHAWRVTGRAGEPPLTRYAVESLAEPRMLDITRAQRELGYSPRWSIEDGPV